MSQPGQVIDCGEFARAGGSVDGVLDIAACSRLGDALADASEAPAGVSEAVCFSLRGEAGSDGDLFLNLRIEGELRLRCQRCLDALDFPLQVIRRLKLVPPGAPWPDADLTDETSDAIALEPTLDVASLVEEEILLALPLAPRHDVCAVPAGAGEAGAIAPLGALAALKRRGPRSADN